MVRVAPLVRDAGPGDASQLLLLWSSVAPAAERGDQARTDAQQAVANIAASPDERLLVVEEDDRVVAALMLQRGPMSPLSPEQVLHASYLMVLPECRRHGHAHLLLETAVAWAEEKDLAQVTGFTDGGRENNRFLARLGLVTIGTVRLTATSALRKRLTNDRVVGRRHGNRHLVEVLAARRSARRRQVAG